MNQTDRESHWDGRYRSIGSEFVSWFEAEPEVSLELIDLTGVAPSASLIDVGGGASALAAELQRRSFSDLTVLDVSSEALDASRNRVERPGDVTWIRSDITDWSPARRWTLWHDRAVFHFLTEPEDRQTYRALLHRAVEPGGFVILATFDDNGPGTCSGLPVMRYTPDSLLAEVGPGLTELARRTVDHLTPSGGIQPFTWIVTQLPIG